MKIEVVTFGYFNAMPYRPELQVKLKAGARYISGKNCVWLNIYKGCKNDF
jgi:hypothetical protein